jgi:hemerythrin-like domain-containing protein
MEFSESFIKEHAPIRRAVIVLERMVLEAESGAPIDRHAVNALLIFLHYFADVCHQAKEETILFPALRESLSLKSAQVEDDVRKQLEHLLTEHTADRSLIEQTQLELFSENPNEFVGNARKLAHLLSSHASEEERVLFPLAEEILNSSQAQDLAMRIQEADARFGCAQRTLLMDMLKELESRYLPKAA